jgi:hypothetical protein
MHESPAGSTYAGGAEVAANLFESLHRGLARTLPASRFMRLIFEAGLMDRVSVNIRQRVPQGRRGTSPVHAEECRNFPTKSRREGRSMSKAVNPMDAMLIAIADYLRSQRIDPREWHTINLTMKVTPTHRLLDEIHITDSTGRVRQSISPMPGHVDPTIEMGPPAS